MVVGAWARLLHAHTRDHDIVFGTTVSGRPPELPGIESAIGLFINTLPLRVRFDNASSLLDWLHEIQRQQVAVRQFEFSPLAAVQYWSDISSGERLFDSIVVFENYPDTAGTDLQDLDITVDEFAYFEQSNYPLALLVVPGEEVGLHLVCESRRYSQSFAKSLLQQLKHVLASFVSAPESNPTDHLLVPREHGTGVSGESCGPHVDIPPSTIHALIERHASSAPGDLAVVFEQQSVTYGQLIARAAALARTLKEAGVARGHLVGLLAERSVDLIVGIIGILKAGAAYVPLDPDYPSRRLEQILVDAKPSRVVLQDGHQALLADVGIRIETTVIDADSTDGHPRDAIESMDVTDDDWETPAYVIYTSGSQGMPKGVTVSHRNLVSSTLARQHFYRNRVRRFLLLSSFAFDSSVAGIFSTLVDGGTLVLPPQRLEQDLDRLAELIEAHQVTHTLCLPSLYALLIEHVVSSQLASLTTVIVAGEACSNEVIRSHHTHLPEAKLFNEYGPTEATVWCTAAELTTLHQSGPVPIGRPIANTTIRVLDEQLQPVPAGVCGELCVSGPGVTRGYRGRSEETETRFCRVPRSSPAERDGPADGYADNLETMYRTGDLAYAAADGELFYAGRIDKQVKIRGYRIELGEIESVIRQDPSVSDVVVVARSPRPHASNDSTSAEELRSALDNLGPAEANRLLRSLRAIPSGDLDDLLQE